MYAINAEVYLRLFLDNPLIPLDNNVAERSIRTFCVGKKNWQIAGSPRGAEASAFYYSLAETAKANGLKPRAYLLDQILIHIDYAPSTYMESIMPWSETLLRQLLKADQLMTSSRFTAAFILQGTGGLPFTKIPPSYCRCY